MTMLSFRYQYISLNKKKYKNDEKDYGKANKYTGDSLHGPKKLVYASILIFLTHLFNSTFLKKERS